MTDGLLEAVIRAITEYGVQFVTLRLMSIKPSLPVFLSLMPCQLTLEVPVLRYLVI